MISIILFYLLIIYVPRSLSFYRSSFALLVRYRFTVRSSLLFIYCSTYYSFVTFLSLLFIIIRFQPSFSLASLAILLFWFCSLFYSLLAVFLFTFYLYLSLAIYRSLSISLFYLLFSLCSLFSLSLLSFYRSLLARSIFVYRSLLLIFALFLLFLSFVALLLFAIVRYRLSLIVHFIIVH